MRKEFEKQLELMRKLCKKDGVAISIWANGTWEQLGGKINLYNLSDLMIFNKPTLCEMVRKLKMELDVKRDNGE